MDEERRRWLPTPHRGPGPAGPQGSRVAASVEARGAAAEPRAEFAASRAWKRQRRRQDQRHHERDPQRRPSPRPGPEEPRSEKIGAPERKESDQKFTVPVKATGLASSSVSKNGEERRRRLPAEVRAPRDPRAVASQPPSRPETRPSRLARNSPASRTRKRQRDAKTNADTKESPSVAPPHDQSPEERPRPPRARKTRRTRTKNNENAKHTHLHLPYSLALGDFQAPKGGGVLRKGGTGVSKGLL